MEMGFDQSWIWESQAWRQGSIVDLWIIVEGGYHHGDHHGDGDPSWRWGAIMEMGSMDSEVLLVRVSVTKARAKWAKNQTSVVVV